jgi:hypothetical protein
VRGNRGSRSAGVDGQTAYHVAQVLGVERFLADVREELRSESFRPLPAKERLIPKPTGGGRRRLGIPDRRGQDRADRRALIPAARAGAGVPPGLVWVSAGAVRA